MTRGTGRRGGKPLDDDFQDDKTGDRGDDAATAAAAEAAEAANEQDDEDDGGDEGAEATDKVKPGPNTLNALADKVADQAAAWEDQQAEIDAIMDEAKQRCQPYKDEQKAIVTAVAEGSANEPALPKAVFRAILGIRRDEAKKRRKIDKLNDDQKDELMALAEMEGREGLVPLPMFQWALDQAKKTKAKPSTRGARK